MNNNYQIALNSDPVMKQLLSRIALPVIPQSKDLFTDIVRAIIAQQLSSKVASVIFSRYLNLIESERFPALFIQNSDQDILRGVGISAQKCNYLREAASYFLNHDLLDADWPQWSDDDIIKTLTQIKGVGVWTVQMLLIFSLNREDVFPVDDLAIQNQMIKYYKLTNTGKELKKEMTVIAENWRPYRTAASRILWASKESGVYLE